MSNQWAVRTRAEFVQAMIDAYGDDYPLAPGFGAGLTPARIAEIRAPINTNLDALFRGIGVGSDSAICGWGEITADLFSRATGPTALSRTVWRTGSPITGQTFDNAGPVEQLDFREEFLHDVDPVPDPVSGELLIYPHIHFSFGANHQLAATANQRVRFRVWMDLAQVAIDPVEPFVPVLTDVVFEAQVLPAVGGATHGYQTVAVAATDVAGILAESTGMIGCIQRDNSVEDNAPYPVFPIAFGIHYLTNKLGTDNPLPPYMAGP